jgi:molybdopterin converting factor small subunit
MLILVKFYSLYKTLTGLDQTTIEIPERSTVDQLIKTLASKFESTIFDNEQCLVVINNKIPTQDQLLIDGDTAMILNLFVGG